MKALFAADRAAEISSIPRDSPWMWMMGHSGPKAILISPLLTLDDASMAGTTTPPGPSSSTDASAGDSCGQRRHLDVPRHDHSDNRHQPAAKTDRFRNGGLSGLRPTARARAMATAKASR